MTEIYIQLLLLGLAIAIFPIPIIAIVLILLTPKGKVNGPLFLLGWIGGFLAIGTITLFIESPFDTNEYGETALWTYWLKLLIGLVLIALCLYKWISKKKKDVTETPKWMKAIDSFTAKKSLIAGFALSGLNPKNILIMIGSATTIAQQNLSFSSQLVAWILFTLVASLGIIVPVAMMLLMGESAKKVLDSVKTFMEKHNTMIVITLLLLIGLKLIYDGMLGLV